MSTTVTITGTGCPIPDANRAGPGVLVRYNELSMQFDAGRSTVQRLAGADLWVPSLTAVFLTHYHSDHCSGLADVALTYWIMDRTDAAPPLTIVAPEGETSRYVESLLANWEDDVAVRAAHAGRSSRPGLDVRPFAVPDHPTEVWRRSDAQGEVVVSAGQVRHEPVVGAVGYRVDTPDGSLAITGDTLVCDEVAELATGVDVLVYEAMRFDYFDTLPERRRYITEYHADTRLIGRQAAELEVPTLVLTHLIPAPESDTDRQAFVNDIRAGGYVGDVIVADDLYSVTLGQQQSGDWSR